MLMIFGIHANSNSLEQSYISQAVFAKNVVQRTPQNIVSEINNDIGKIYFFTNLRNFAGQKLTHRWIYNDKVMAEVHFAPKGPRWRVYSSKNLWHNWTGMWKVEVVNESDEVILTKSFMYNKK
jgi:hypothetical protein